MEKNNSLLNFVSELKEIEYSFSQPHKQVEEVNKHLKSGWILVNVSNSSGNILESGENAPVYVVGKLNEMF